MQLKFFSGKLLKMYLNLKMLQSLNQYISITKLSLKTFRIFK